ncbi:unnamed protein product [Chironomus riparius]|uniref:Uncharacterized protein n=1 Tax=Chironomus riparius TaxID=315576 RepID=A0A9N9WYC5_9DIPT|nr:unnamed protein product [Chironomus riparius]
MKLIFAILLTLLTISQCQAQQEPSKMSLNQAYQKIEKESTKSSGFNPKLEKFLKNLNLNCIKEKLKLSENGDKQLKDIEIMILVTKSITACSGHDASEFWKAFIEDNMPKGNFKMSAKDLQCVKLNYKHNNPESRLVSDFDVNSLTEAQIQACDEEIKEKDSHLEDGIARTIDGSDLKIITCGVLDVPKVKNILYKMSILANVNNSVLVNSEVEKLPEMFVQLVDKIFDCIIARLDAMP